MYSELNKILRERFDRTCANTENKNNMRRREGQEKRRVEKEKLTHKQKTALVRHGCYCLTIYLFLIATSPWFPGRLNSDAHWQTLHPQVPPQPSLTWCPFLWPLSRVDNGDSRLPLSMLVHRTCRWNRVVTTTGVRYTDLVLEVSEVVYIFSPVVAEGRKKK